MYWHAINSRQEPHLASALLIQVYIIFHIYIILCVDHEMTTMQCRKLILGKNWSYASSVLLEITYL